LCRSHNWALEVGKGLGVAVTTTTTAISSSVGALPYGSYLKQKLEASVTFCGTSVIRYTSIHYYLLLHKQENYYRFFKSLRLFLRLSVCLSVCSHESGRFPLDGFSWYLMLGTFMKSAKKLQIWLKSHNNLCHITWCLKYVHIVGSSVKYFLARKHCKLKALLPVLGNTDRFSIVDSYV
jgi:hypothetical protein